MKTLFRYVRNGVILIFLAIALVDSFPFYSKQLEPLRTRIDPVIDVLGIWQGPWELFAPNVDRQNHRIEALVFYDADDEPEVVTSPDWNALNCFEKFQHSRDIEFYDRIRKQANEPAWASFTRYLKELTEQKNPATRVTRVELYSIVTPIPLPAEAAGRTSTDKTLFFTGRFEE